MWQSTQKLSDSGAHPWLRRGTLVSLALLALAATAIVGGRTQAGPEVPGIQQVRNVLALLDARSPGERASGELTSTKLERPERQLANPRPARKERVLRSRLIPPVPQSLEDLLQGPLAENTALLAEPAPLSGDFALADLPPLTSVVIPASGGTGGAGGASGGSGGGGSGGGGGASSASPEIVAPTVAAAVPEPSTWAMMLIGFGMIGFGLRRRGKQGPSVSLAFDDRE